MIIVLDSNEYLTFFNEKSLLLRGILENEKITICTNELIIKEVLRNLDESIKKNFYKLLFNDNIKVHKEKLPAYLFKKYKSIGLKKGDIEIAAFCEFADAQYLIAENRHFLKNMKFDKFEVFGVKNFLGKMNF